LSAAAPILLKAVLAPGLIALATLVGRRWGPAVGGAVTGFPLTSLPVSVFLALEQGPAFAATAAVATLLGLLGQAALCLAYAWTARVAGWPVAAGAGVAAFSLVALALAEVRLTVGPALVLVGPLLVVATVLVPGGSRGAPPATPPRWDLPLRMLAATGVVLGLTAAASWLGPWTTGLLSPFPVFTLVLAGFAHRTDGPVAAGRLLRGVAAGSLAHALSFALLGAWLPVRSLAVTYPAAALVAATVNTLAVLLARRRL
jgi:hypothetical protein